MLTAVIKLTEIQAALVDQVIKNSPWAFKKAKGFSFEFLEGDESELEFQFEIDDYQDPDRIRKYEASDEYHLHHITYAAQSLGWPQRTCVALRGKIHNAAGRMRRYHKEKKAA
jgi:hypothetical protein